VYQGELATRALEALGARAMTVDRTIIVAEDFDPGNIEDQALYAHEQHHAEHGDGGGGGGADNFRDAEEIAARAAEALVLHRSAAGGAEAGHTPGGGSGHTSHDDPHRSGGSVSAGAPDASTSPAANKDPDAESGYAALRAKGMSHDDVIDHLARRVLSSLDEKTQLTRDRRKPGRGW
jgi:hypothetical protein